MPADLAAMSLVETEDLTKKFGTFTAVKHVKLHVNAGEVLALLGPNGAGKTTTIRMLASILRPTRGWARIQDYDVVDDPVSARHAVGLLTEHHGLYTRMKPVEYLTFFGKIYKLPHDPLHARILTLLDSFGLGDAVDMRLGQFSKGMRQKLALVRALLHDPPVLLLDEPTSAMDPESAHLVRESILSLRTNKRATIVCTHNLHEAESIADRIAIIRRGEIVAQGTPSELKRSLLGAPIMELRLGAALDGALQLFPDGIRILERGEDWVRYQVANPRDTNPRLLKGMAEADIPVVTLSEVKRSLEEVYLQVVTSAQTSQERLS
jgi:ABC-2 type transport system ATP-binding protein